jgi:hypothetical protein
MSARTVASPAALTPQSKQSAPAKRRRVCGDLGHLRLYPVAEWLRPVKR